MALVDMKLPQCDCCGAIGLPRPGPARDDPRGKRADGSGKRNHDRCGTCKGDWDRDYVPEVETPELAQVNDEMSFALEVAMDNVMLPKPEICAGARSFSEQLKERVGEMTGATKRRCIHGLIGCTICAKES